MLAKRLIKSNDAGGGACTNTVDLYNPFPDGGGVALYQLNGDATDVSGNYNATGVSGVTWGTTGVFGTCADLTLADNSTITLPNSSPIPSNLNFTVSLWIKGNDISTSTDDICIANLYGSYFLLGVKSNKLTVLFSDSSSQANRFESPAILNSSTFNHVVVASNGLGSTCSVYINGSNVGTFSMASTTRSLTLGNAIGGIPGIIQYGFQGQIDQVRIFNRALRPYEVEALYTEEYCTPTIVPSEHFNTVTYTGNRGIKEVTGIGFQPDFIWLKNRDAVASNFLHDTVRGKNNNYYECLISNGTFAESTTNQAWHDSYGWISDIYDGGFTVNQGSVIDDPSYNNTQDYVAWNFKAGGAAVTNTDGTITSQVSANTEAGFSIVTFTSPNGAANTSYTVGHGLETTPNVVIVKSRNAAGGWYTYHSGGTNNNQFIRLDTTGAVATAGSAVWGAGMTNNVIGVTLDQSIDQNDTNVAYCFAEVEGFSNFGSFVGTGTSVNVITGFEPAFVIWKNVSQGSASYDYWFTVDNKRSPENPIKKVLYPNDSSAEDTTTTYDIANFYENGFQIVGNQSGNRVFNNAGDTYIYMAFAADPTAVEPTLEDSFNTAIWNGGTPQSINVGFEPDLIWIKSRGVANNHNLADSVRGIEKILYSNLINSEAERLNSIETTSTGFNLLDTWAGRNDASYGGYVGWAWKGAELPAINSNGSIPSVVSANPAAGFSIVSYTGNGVSVSSVGHGLSDSPKLVIVKRRDTTGSWWQVYSFEIGYTQRLYLNHTGAAETSCYQGLCTWIDNPDSELIHIGNNADVNANNGTYIAYCFAEVAGFSKFGSYTGTGASGKSVTTDFEPAMIIVKRTDAVSSWRLLDNKRFSGSNKSSLIPNSSAAEQVGYIDVDFNPTNFTINSTNIDFNANGGTYIYMAFANQF